jgi:catechol 2,3-dioxygenase-like lactoylglutathione lyase family enzyme
LITCNQSASLYFCFGAYTPVLNWPPSQVARLKAVWNPAKIETGKRREPGTETFNFFIMKLRKLSPILWTKDLDATIAFYQNVLGFTPRTQFDNFVSLTREEVDIMFIVPQDEPEDCVDPDEKAEFFPKTLLTGSLYIFTEEVDKVWESVKDRATIKTHIDDRQYWMRDFSILDNNGYEVVFGEDISSRAK